MTDLIPENIELTDSEINIIAIKNICELRERVQLAAQDYKDTKLSDVPWGVIYDIIKLIYDI